MYMSSGIWFCHCVCLHVFALRFTGSVKAPSSSRGYTPHPPRSTYDQASHGVSIWSMPPALFSWKWRRKKWSKTVKRASMGPLRPHPCVPLRPSFICHKLVECIASMNDNSRPPSPNAPPQDLWSTILNSPSSSCSIPATNVLVLQLARVPSYLPFSKNHLQMPASMNHVQTLH